MIDFSLLNQLVVWLVFMICNVMHVIKFEPTKFYLLFLPELSKNFSHNSFLILVSNLRIIPIIMLSLVSAVK